MLGGSAQLKNTISQQALIVVRSGRKRKSTGSRRKDGHLTEALSTDPRVVAFAMPHRQDAPAEVRHDPRAECSLGRLCLSRKITDEQYEAGTQWARLVNRYRASIEAPRQGQSIAGVMEPKGGSPLSLQRAREIKDEYDAAFEKLGDAGNLATRIVNRVAVHGGEITKDQHSDLFRGLNALAGHFKLTKGRKSDNPPK